MSNGTPPLRPALKMTVNPASDGTPTTLSPTSGTNTPSTVASFAHQQGYHGHSPRGSISGLGVTGAGFPRTMTSGTNSSIGDGGKYRRKVGFETFDAQPESLFTYTCQAKSEGYKRSRNTRVFLVAVSPDESGEDALDWLMSELVEDGDEVIAMRVKDLGESERHTEVAHEHLREEGDEMLQQVLQKNNEEDGRKISVIVEVVVGHIPEMILKMIALYRPDSLVVGTKGQRSKVSRWGKAFGAPGMGSISRFAVSHSPVPVIVVRPERKVKKTQQKREAAGKRGQYAALVGDSDNDIVLSRSRSRERSRSRGRSMDTDRE